MSAFNKDHRMLLQQHRNEIYNSGFECNAFFSQCDYEIFVSVYNIEEGIKSA